MASRGSWMGVASGRRGEAAERWMVFVGTHAEMIPQVRQSPLWPHLESRAQSHAYDTMSMEDMQKGSPEPLKKWEPVTISTLVMDGTVMMGSEQAHTLMRDRADALLTLHWG